MIPLRTCIVTATHFFKAPILQANIVFQAQYEPPDNVRMASALILRKHAALDYHSPHFFSHTVYTSIEDTGQEKDTRLKIRTKLCGKKINIKFLWFCNKKLTQTILLVEIFLYENI